MYKSTDMKLVYPAYSKLNFYFRQHISKFVLEKGFVPLNPFMIFDYFLSDTVDRDLVRNANNSMVKKADELWVFGQVSDGVFAEIKLAKQYGKPIRYFDIIKSKDIIEIAKDKVIFEDISASVEEL
ncbi:MAG TPA: hypothetical protein PK655_00060 [archaeon]|jgi:hypothetical protein|nr:hypothetical protein [archaeon]